MNPVLWFFVDRPGLMAALLAVLLSAILVGAVNRSQQRRLARQQAEQEEIARQRAEREALSQTQSARPHIRGSRRVRPKPMMVEPEWYEHRIADRIITAILTPIVLGAYFLPLIAACVAGFVIAHFNRAELHHSLGVSILYGFWLPVLLASLFYGMYRNAIGAGSEIGCGCGLMPLILFFILWPVYTKMHFTMTHHSKPALSQPHVSMPKPNGPH